MILDFHQRTQKLIASPFAEKWILIATCLFAFSVSLGVAVVSISTLFLLICLLCSVIYRGKIFSDTAVTIRTNFTVSFIFIALIWFLISFFWTISDYKLGLEELVRYCRLLIIPIVYFLIRTPSHGLKVIHVWILGQVFVIFNSYWLWFGFPAPWATSYYAYAYAPFTTTLEQPIMSTLMVAVLWFYRSDFKSLWGNFAVYLVLLVTVLNVFFLMVGRSGMLSMILFISLSAWWSIKPKFRWAVLILPFMIFGLLYLSSPKFSEKIQRIPYEISEYQNGRVETSQAFRLDFWHRSVQAIEKRPILGFGIGSWRLAYKLVLNGEVGVKADSPHQQFLLWWVEGGVIGFVLLLCIYVSIYLDSLCLENKARYSLITVLGILFFTSLMNCPLQGAGMSEFFCVIIGGLMAFSKTNAMRSQ